MDSQVPQASTPSPLTPPPQTSKLPLIVGAILLLFVAVGGAYYLGTQRKNSQELPKLSSIDTQQTTADEFIINELGIKFPIASITDFDYVIRSGIGDEGEYKIADFSTKTLESTGGKYCGTEGGPIGSIEVLSSPLTQEQGGQALGPYVAKVGSKYIYYAHPQSTCSDDKSVQELAGKAIAELQQQLKLAKPIQSTEETADWKTYTSTEYKFTLMYPSTVVHDQTLDSTQYNKSHEFFRINGGVLEIYGVCGRGIRPIKQQEIVVGGTKTTKFYETNTHGGIAAISRPNSNESICFNFTLPDDPTKTDSVDALFNQILSSFKFTESEKKEASNLKTHTSKYFSVSYPNTWYEWSFGRGVDLDFYQINSIPESQGDSDNRSHITFDIQGMTYTENKTVEEQKKVVEDLKRKYPEWNYLISEQVINGQKALAYEKTIDNSPAYEEIIWVVNNNVKYIITWTVHAKTVQERNKLTNLYKTDFDKIISTFKFTL